MSWQKCPVCSGSGQRPGNYTSNRIEECSVCLGQKIIHEVTGRPPRVKDIDEQKKEAEVAMLEATRKLGW